MFVSHLSSTSDCLFRGEVHAGNDQDGDGSKGTEQMFAISRQWQEEREAEIEKLFATEDPGGAVERKEISVPCAMLKILPLLLNEKAWGRNLI